MKPTKDRKALWMLPWGYPESFLLAFALLLAALGLEIITGTKAPTISWPANFVSIILLATLSLILFLIAKKKPFFRWFYSVPASIASVCLFVVPSVLMALVPQRETDTLFFLYDVTSSWPYTIGVTFFLVILGTVTIKRLTKISKKNVGFFLNHFGLWLCIAAAHLGAGDMEKLNMYLEEGKTVWYGVNKAGQPIELDFAVKLRDFSMEEYPAKIAFVDRTSGELMKQNNKPLLIDPMESMVFQFQDQELKIEQLLMNSAPIQNRFEPLYGMGATQSAKIIRTQNEVIDTFWISSQGVLYPQQYYELNASAVLVMLKPEPKRFLSEITVLEQTGDKYDTQIEVNKPITISSWKIYQTSYDESKGRWSTYSTLELVKDPWLPAVYIGFFLLIAGTFYLIWTGKKKEQK